ncbi:MAG: hypothetical protein KatS3mg050_0948 [Litorilinea sp.]|nr:MAG: hypothetical protein KatS3mg050_0948 [Litorilinea sp.]
MSRPTFTVIIPTHNRAHLLPRAIRSVLAQTFTDFELIVVDDASTDETPQVVASVQDGRIIYLRHEENRGAAATRNTGICHARGKYVAFLDDDDEYLPEFLAETRQHLETASEEAGFSWCGVRVVQDGGQGERTIGEGVWRPAFQDREHAYLSFLRSRRIGTNCGLCVRRDCFDVVGLFDQALRKAEDTDFLIRLVRHYDFVVVPKVLVKVHAHAGPKLHRLRRPHGPGLRTHHAETPGHPAAPSSPLGPDALQDRLAPLPRG